MSAKGLSIYKEKIENSFVIKDLRTFKQWPATMEKWDSMFEDYPKMAAEVFEALFIVDGHPQKHLKDRIMPIIRQRGFLKLFREIRGALKSL